MRAKFRNCFYSFRIGHIILAFKRIIIYTCWGYGRIYIFYANTTVNTHQSRQSDNFLKRIPSRAIKFSWHFKIPLIFLPRGCFISRFFFISLSKTHRVIVIENRSFTPYLILYHCVLPTGIYICGTERFLNFSQTTVGKRNCGRDSRCR